MAFRRTTRTRFKTPFRGRRAFRGFRRSSPYARKKYDTIMLYDNVEPLATGNLCGPLIIGTCDNSMTFPGTDIPRCGQPNTDELACCLNTTTFNLFNNDFLEATYQDKVTIVRIFGWMRIRHLISYPLGSDRCLRFTPTPDQVAARYAEETYLGLHKYFRGQSPDDTVVDDRANLAYSYDWTEVPWLWRRYRFWEPTTRIGATEAFQGNVAGVCPDVSGGSLLNELVEGTGNVNTNIDTTCNLSQYPNEGCPYGTNYVESQLPPWHTFLINIKKHITMRRDEDLTMQMAWIHPARSNTNAAANAGWGCDPAFINETSGVAVRLRIAAVLRLN